MNIKIIEDFNLEFLMGLSAKAFAAKALADAGEKESKSSNQITFDA